MVYIYSHDAGHNAWDMEWFIYYTHDAGHSAWARGVLYNTHMMQVTVPGPGGILYTTQMIEVTVPGPGVFYYSNDAGPSAWARGCFIGCQSLAVSRLLSSF